MSPSESDPDSLIPPTITITEHCPQEPEGAADVDQQLLALIDEPTPAPNPTPAFFAAPPVREAAKKSGRAIGKVPLTTTIVKTAPSVRQPIPIDDIRAQCDFRDEGNRQQRLVRPKAEAQLVVVVAVQVQSLARRKSPLCLHKHRRTGLAPTFNPSLLHRTSLKRNLLLLLTTGSTVSAKVAMMMLG